MSSPPPGPRRTVLILGATSAIARAVASEFGRRGFDLLLAGRDTEELELLAADLRIRHGVGAAALPFEALAYETHARFLEECQAASAGTIEGAVLCFGTLGDQASAQADFAHAREILETNFVADRGRQSNYIYGAAKAGLSAYLQGLRNRLFPAGVRVVTIKPGFVDTAMTFGRPGMFLVASPEAVARRIVGAITGREDVAYVPRFWRLVMILLRLVPEALFKRMRL